ncbi:MAG: fused MFS/spermidine synthase [Phycisphaerales bacterium]
MLALFALTIFTGAALLFLVQPMMAKLALPLLGGSPAVWNTCVLFFQAALLAGYAYAHWSVKWLGPRRQAAVHIAVVLLPLLALPVAIGHRPSAGASPILWLLMALGAGAGLPFLVASTCGPLTQRWFAATGHSRGRDPYFLYAASNAGSLLALLAYPALIEPLLPLGEQRDLWTMGYIVFAALTVACAGVVLARARAGAAEARAPRAALIAATSDDPAPTALRRAKWVLLAFIPSSLTLGATQYLSTDIAAVPMLWVVPMAIYLLTFVFAFARQSPSLPALARLLPVSALGLAVAFLIDARRPVWVLMVLHLAGLFLGALLCHCRLVAMRPAPSRLTEFYLWIALGGVLGGAFNALAAPVIFNSIVEYPLVIVLALLMRPRAASRFDRLPRWLLFIADFAIPVLIGGLALWLDDHIRGDLVEHAAMEDRREVLRLAVSIGIPSMLCYLLAGRPVGYALGVAALFATGMIFGYQRDGERLLTERTFYGVYTVSRGEVFTTLVHGTTTHGLQYTVADPQFRAIPLGYYHPLGPIGKLIHAYRDTQGPDGRHLLGRAALVGMGTGALAAYFQDPRQRITFHEIDPAMVAIATNPAYFTYIPDCKATWNVELGDGRLTLAAAPDGEFGLIVLDAFTSDAIPVHLLTKEAVEMYARKLRPGGLIAVHISNQYVDLEPPLGRIAEHLGMACLVRRDDTSEQVQRESGRYSSIWLVMAHGKADLAPLSRDALWLSPVLRPEVGLWTDDFSNLWSVFDWN